MIVPVDVDNNGIKHFHLVSGLINDSLASLPFFSELWGWEWFLPFEILVFNVWCCVVQVRQHEFEQSSKEGDRGSKMVSEIYLPRLLVTKVSDQFKRSPTVHFYTHSTPSAFFLVLLHTYSPTPSTFFLVLVHSYSHSSPSTFFLVLLCIAIHPPLQISS
jgi:hypothetical protein